MIPAKDQLDAIKRRYQIKCARRVSGMTFIRYAQNRMIGKQIHVKFWEQ